MTRTLFALILLATTLPAHAADYGWSKLWRNADQRGEQLLQQGNAAAAASAYADPRRKAHAELLAGDYAQAARDLAAFDDTDAHYNRGNALAHAGDLQNALRAYDAALQRDPKNQDARHNRDLVARALKQKPPPPQQGSSGKSSKENPSEKQNGNGQGSSSSQGTDRPQENQDKHGKQGNAAAAEKNGKGEQRGQPSASNDPPREEQSGQSGKQASAAEEKKAKNAPGASASQPSEPQQYGGASTGSTAGPERDSAAQARRDVAASLTGAASSRQRGMGRGDESGDDGNQQAAPFNEQKLAQEQWLHSIPDDPGGLLRRKFLVEHLMRQQKAQQ